MTTLEILRSGPLALVEDLGRAGLAHLGVGRSGAADRRSTRWPAGWSPAPTIGPRSK